MSDGRGRDRAGRRGPAALARGGRGGRGRGRPVGRQAGRGDRHRPGRDRHHRRRPVLARQSRRPGGGDGELIAAPEGDYKVKPDDPRRDERRGRGRHRLRRQRGRPAEGQSSTPTRCPKRRSTRPPAPRRAAARRSRGAAAPAPPRPAAARRRRRRPAAGGPTIQLGAFSSQAGANRAWTALSGRFRYLAPLGHTVVAGARSAAAPLYRLRASGAGAADVCRRLRVAGEDCSVVS